MRPAISALVAGVLFGVGLVVSGMASPEKVVSFFDISAWDPTLAFVMGGASLAYAPLFRLILRRKMPYWSGQFHLPTRRDIDPRLIAGAAIFGVGWGLGGYCPGPGIASASAGLQGGMVFALTMVLGMVAFELMQRALARRAGAETAEDEAAQKASGSAA